ncbi:MAG: class I SAM-dependent RNA methyltransferase [Treponema sp.]|nr:class I SAM-dependent RNA methyltransferase [Treponema sp.]
MNTLVALCAVGAEKILGNELKLLGYKLVSNAPGRVTFTGDDDALFRTNLCLRTADRVYLQMAEFNAADFDQLFDGVYAVNWQDFLRKDSRVVVDKVRCYKSALNSEHSIQGMVQKAIYTKLGDMWHIQTLPESGEECDVRVYLDEDRALILLDLSGLPLHKRGYRTDGGFAPLRETTAAVLLQLMMWRRKMPLHDPFCGSGTFPIEAALYAYNVAPGFGRRFALENLPIFNSRRAHEIKCAEAEKIRTDVEVRITGTDIDPAAIERARKNAEHACVMAGRALNLIDKSNKVPRPDFDVADFSDITAPYQSGLIICNPPYGERLGDAEQAEELYRKMNSLFEEFKGWQLGVITAHKKFQECVGRYATTLKSLKAGNLDTTFYMYTGEEKQKSHTADSKKSTKSKKRSDNYGNRSRTR